MNLILDRYGALLCEVDRWFSRCSHLHPVEISCHKGCSACCRGLFDITVMDALYLKRGFDSLDATLRQHLHRVALERLRLLSEQFPPYSSPWFLNCLPEETQAAMMPEDDQTPCIFLSGEGNCLVYEHRPMTCRLHGIPLFDVDGEAFSDEWCSLNFIESNPEGVQDIRYQFRELFFTELRLFRALTHRMFGKALNELDTLIPAAIMLELSDADSGTGRE